MSARIRPTAETPYAPRRRAPSRHAPAGRRFYAGAGSLVLAVELDALFVFLPRGKGALILLLGGLLMVVCSILWLMMRPRVTPILAIERARPAPDEVDHSARAAHLAKWLGATAKRAGMRRAQVIMAGSERGLVLLGACPTCRRLGLHTGGCEPERRRLEVAAQTQAAGARVREVSCNVMGTGACIFEVSAGVAP